MMTTQERETAGALANAAAAYEERRADAPAYPAVPKPAGVYVETLPSGLRVLLRQPTMRTLIRLRVIEAGDPLFTLIWTGGIATADQVLRIKDLMVAVAVRGIWDDATGTYQAADLVHADLEDVFRSDDLAAITAFVDMPAATFLMLYADGEQTGHGRLRRGPAPWDPEAATLGQVAPPGTAPEPEPVAPDPAADWENG